MKAGNYGETYCKAHKDGFIDYKCRFCCSVALYFCFGTHHFCDPCHRLAWTIRNKTEQELEQCKGVESCPLAIGHPPNGNEYALGCGLCREIKMKAKPAPEKADEEEKEEEMILDF